MNIHSIVHKIYEPVTANKALKEIYACINAYTAKIKKKDYALTHKDMVLITYGDQVYQKNEPKLTTLKRFVDKFIYPYINSIHILPFYPYSSDDGFSVIDYKEVDPNLGTWKQIDMLSNDYRIMFDAVINHISKSSKWFKEYLLENPTYASFFINIDPNIDLSKVVRPRAFPLLTKFQTVSGKNRYIWTTFSNDQVDLNYHNYHVLVAVLDVLLFYIASGAKLIRLDAVGFMWKEMETTCMHLPQVHYIIQLYRKIIDTLAPEVILITETNVPHDENISYFGNGYNEAQMVYNFSLPPLLVYSIHNQDVEILTKWAQSLKLPSKKTCFFNFTASHDGVGIRPLKGIIADDEIENLAQIAEKHGGYVSYKNNEDGTQSPYELNCNYLDLITHPSENDEWKTRRFLLTQAVMLAMPGVPGIYFHSLVGSQNYNRGVVDTGIKRRINREKLSFEELVAEINDENSLRHNVYTAYKSLLKVRANEELFYPFGDFSFSKIDNQVFAIQRNHKSLQCSLLAVFNFSEQQKIVHFEKDSGGMCIINKRKVERTIDLQPFDFMWIKFDER